jgi:hypothetical protein
MMTVALGFATRAGAGAYSAYDTTAGYVLNGINGSEGVGWYKSKNGGRLPASWSWWGTMGKPTGPWTDGTKNYMPPLNLLEGLRDYPGGSITPMLNIMYHGPSFLRKDFPVKFNNTASASGIADGEIRFNSTNPASVTEIYISEKSAAYYKDTPTTRARRNTPFDHLIAGEKIVVSASPFIEKSQRQRL